ncbi:deoxycytidylate deaminase [Streptomyces sp. CoH17]|uniref:deoxycytidylate deaminase n=1 Tax=Streptomyces sp. CoH17 TaxID=2992806 RepID=UPI002D1E39E5|nr:deaminase [Streptomyces sp. CoH17]
MSMRPSWTETWMNIAKELARRAPCTRSQVGCIVVAANQFVWPGYNGVPSGEKHCTDGGCPRGLLTYEELPPEGDYSNCKAVHAEVNAIRKAGEFARGAVIFVTRRPCSDCRQAIVQSQLSEMVYLDESGQVVREGI